MPRLDNPAGTSSSNTSGVSLKDYGAKCDVKMSFTATVTSGSATLTDPNAAFTSSDVGKSIWINGAPLVTISTVNSATSINVSANSSYSQAGNVAFAYGTDDTTAITAAITAIVATGGGTINVPGLTFDTITRTFTEKQNITFRGVGGRVGVGGHNGGQFTGGAVAYPNSGLIYTGAGSGGYLKFVDCLSINIRDMAVLYTQTAYTGDLITFGGTNGSTPGMFFTVKDCLLAPAVDSPNFQANCLVNLSGAVFVNLQDNSYGVSTYHIIGLDPDATAKGLTNGFSNAVTITGGGTQFSRAKTACVFAPGSSWQFFGITFEPKINGAAAAVVCSTITHNLLFSGCGFWDATAGGTWAVVKGERITFRDCYFEDQGNNDIYIDASQGSTAGLIIEGCQFDGFGSPTGQTVVKPPANGSGFTTTALWFKANTFKSGPTDPTTALQAASTVTFAT